MIRELHLSDETTLRAVLEISLSAYRVEGELIGVSDFPPLRETLEALAESPNVFWGEVKERELVGVIELNIREVDVEICRLVVSPDAFRTGVGSRLLSQVIALKKPLTVRTAEKNLPAIALYKRFGFVVTKVDTERIPGLSLVTLERGL